MRTSGAPVIVAANAGSRTDGAVTYQDVWYPSDDGLRLHARDYPNPAAAVTLLCMHGLSRNSADFGDLAAELCDQYRVIAVDQRGRGQSEWDGNSANYTPARYVRDMYTLIDRLALDNVVLVGTSMGGIMAMLMAGAHPGRFSGRGAERHRPGGERAGNGAHHGHGRQGCARQDVGRGHRTGQIAQWRRLPPTTVETTGRAGCVAPMRKMQRVNRGCSTTRPSLTPCGPRDPTRCHRTRGRCSMQCAACRSLLCAAPYRTFSTRRASLRCSGAIPA